MGHVVVTGAGGFVGTALCRALRASGRDVVALVRPGAGSAREGGRTAVWDPSAGLFPLDVLVGAEAVFHLAGAGIADGRWTRERRRVIRDSRVQGASLLARALAGGPSPPPPLLCASAVGYYGYRDRGEPQSEASPAGDGFLAEVCCDWEAAAGPLAAAGRRVVFLRFGTILAEGGGMLKKVLPLFRWGLGARFGRGMQPFPWVSREDAVRSALFLLDQPDLSGPVNVVAPARDTNATFTRALARQAHRPAPWAIPAWAVRLLFGQMGRELLLGGVRVEPAKLARAAFRFARPELASVFS